jgi:hypothetical protein
MGKIAVLSLLAVVLCINVFGTEGHFSFRE